MQTPSATQVDIGGRLRHLRMLHGLSQRELAKRAGVTNSTISLIESNGTNPSVGALKRILDGIAKKLNVSPDKIVVTLDRHGNTSAASIPLALNCAFEQHRIKEGSLVLMEAMGGGFTWGAVLARW